MLRLIAAALSWPLRLAGPRASAALLARVAGRLARRLPPAEGARFLMDLDARLYPLHGEAAVRLDGGLHSKHRLMGYHDFFTARIGPGERVVDIGCGIGAVAFDVAARCGAVVTGVDLSAEKIREAKARHSHPRLTFLTGDATRDLPAGACDVVILSNVLEHIEDRVGFLRRVQGALGPRRWLIRVPLFERDWRVPLKRELGVEWRLDPTHCTEYTRESFEAEMAAGGLRATHVEVRWGEIWAELVPGER